MADFVAIKKPLPFEKGLSLQTQEKTFLDFWSGGSVNHQASYYPAIWTGAA
jgi:hypothetical protein